MEVFARTERHPWQPGHPLHNRYKAFARWADNGLLWQAFITSVAHLAVEKHLDLSVLHGDGTNNMKYAKLSVSKIAKQPPAYTIIGVRWVRSCSQASAWRVLSAHSTPLCVLVNR